MLAARYPALWRFFISFSATEEASQLPLEPDPSRVGGGGGGGEKDGNFVGAESLGDWKAKEMRGRGEKSKDPLPSYRR